MIIAKGASREAVEAIANEDPFVAQGLATVRVVEFNASQMAAEVKTWIAR